MSQSLSHNRELADTKVILPRPRLQDGGVLLSQEERCCETRRLVAAWSASTNVVAMFVQIRSSESSFSRFLF
jgi:hypothetical protein